MTRFDDPQTPGTLRESLAGLLDRLTPFLLGAALFAPGLILPKQLHDPVKTTSELLIVIGCWLLVACIGTSRALRGLPLLGGGEGSKIRWALVALAAWAGLSTLWGVHPAAQWTYAATVIAFLLAAQSVLGWLKEREGRGRLLLGLLGGLLAFEVVVAIAQLARVPFLKARGYVPAGGLLDGWLSSAGSQAMKGIPKGTMGNPNYLAELLALLMPVMVGAAFSVRRRAGQVGFGVLAFLATIVLIGTGTRAALLGLGVGAVVALALTGTWRALHPSVWWSDKRKRLAVLVALVGVVALGGLAGARLARKLSNLSVDSNIAGRLDNWRAGASLVADRPLHGHGAGGWKLVGMDRLVKNNPEGLSTDRVSARLFQVHNEPLQAAVELGVVGLLLALAALALWLRRVARNEALAPAMRFGLTWGMLSVLVAGCFGFPFHIPLTAFCILLVVALGMARPAEPAAEAGLPVGWRWGYAVAVLLLSGVIGWLAVSRGQMQVYAASHYHYLGSRSWAKNKEAGGLEVLFGLAARTDRYKPIHATEQLTALSRAHKWEEVLAVHDAYAGEGLGMDALLIRAVALKNLGRKDEAIAALKTVHGYYGPKDRNYKSARKYLSQLGVALPPKQLKQEKEAEIETRENREEEELPEPQAPDSPKDDAPKDEDKGEDKP